MNGNRPRATPDLPVSQVQGSHDLCVDPDTLPALVNVWMVPYPDMAVEGAETT